MNNIERDIERAARSYKISDGTRWAAAYFASRVVGHKPVIYGATIELANRMGKSVDAVEDLAHAYFLYADLRSDPKYRQIVRQIRKMPFIYYSYFRALYEARENYHLSNSEIMDMLNDMLQAEADYTRKIWKGTSAISSGTSATGPTSHRKPKRDSRPCLIAPIFPTMFALRSSRPTKSWEREPEMPTVLRKVEDVDLSGFKHHGGGIMARGGFDIEEVEISVEEYARKLVEEASMHVAYRKWQPMEILNIGQDCRFYLFCEPDRELVLVRVNLSEKFKITGNEWWRKEARTWIVKNYDDDPLEDVVMANMLRKYGEQL